MDVFVESQIQINTNTNTDTGTFLDKLMVLRAAKELVFMQSLLLPIYDVFQKFSPKQYCFAEHE